MNCLAESANAANRKELPTMTSEETRFAELLAHVGHEIEVAAYGGAPPVNVAIECMTCGAVLVDYDRKD